MKRMALLLLMFPFSLIVPVGFALLQAPASQQEDPHAGQPEHCTNAKDAPKAHKCECKKDPGEDGAGCEIEDKSCKVFCRKDKCFCFHHACDS